MWLRLVILIGVVMGMLCFPPCRRSATWMSNDTGSIAPSSLATRNDRFLYGYIPTYVWIGEVGLVIDSDPRVSVNKFSAVEVRLVIDVLVLGIQMLLFLLVAWGVWAARIDWIFQKARGDSR